MGGVETCKALHLVCKATVLVAGLEQLAPDCMKALMVLMQQLPVLLPYLHHHVMICHTQRAHVHVVIPQWYGCTGSKG